MHLSEKFAQQNIETLWDVMNKLPKRVKEIVNSACNWYQDVNKSKVFEEFLFGFQLSMRTK